MLFLLFIHCTKITVYIKIHLFLKKNQLKYKDKKKEEKSLRMRKVGRRD